MRDAMLKEMGFVERETNCNLRIAKRHLQELRVHASIEKQIRVIVATVEKLHMDGLVCEATGSPA